MAEVSEFAHLLDIPVDVEATLPGPALTVEELLNLSAGSLVATDRPAGETIDVYAGDAYIGAGELAGTDGRPVVRMVRFRSKS